MKRYLTVIGIVATIAGLVTIGQAATDYGDHVFKGNVSVPGTINLDGTVEIDGTNVSKGALIAAANGANTNTFSNTNGTIKTGSLTATGGVTAARLVGTMSATNLEAGTAATAFNGAAVTNLNVGNVASNGTFPAENSICLTNLSATNIVGKLPATSGFVGGLTKSYTNFTLQDGATTSAFIIVTNLWSISNGQMRLITTNGVTIP